MIGATGYLQSPQSSWGSSVSEQQERRRSAQLKLMRARRELEEQYGRVVPSPGHSTHIRQRHEPILEKAAHLVALVDEFILLSQSSSASRTPQSNPSLRNPYEPERKHQR